MITLKMRALSISVLLCFAASYFNDSILPVCSAEGGLEKYEKFPTVKSYSGNETQKNVLRVDETFYSHHFNFDRNPTVKTVPRKIPPELKIIKRKKRSDSDCVQDTFINNTSDSNAIEKLMECQTSKDPELILPQCPSYDNILRNQTTLFDSAFQKKVINKTVSIRDRKDCEKNTSIEVEHATVLRVQVENCCVTHCVRNITVKAADMTSHIVFSFSEFNIPGHGHVTAMGEKQCEESLDVIEKFKPYKNDSVTLSNTLGSFCGKKQPSIVYTEHSEAVLRLRLFDNRDCVDKINFEVKISLCTGHIYGDLDTSSDLIISKSVKSPGFVHGRNYPNNYFHVWNISVSEGKLIQLNSKTFDLGNGDTLRVFPLKRKPGLQFPESITYSNRTSFPNTSRIILPSSQCQIEFQSDETGTAKGFWLTFEPVDESQFVPRINASILNCAELEKIPSDIECNYQVDCEDGRDERNCLYRRHTCPQQGYAYNNLCYWVTKKHGSSWSWLMAEDYCWKTHRGHLISLNTVKERHIFDKLLDLFKIDYLFIGLKRMNSIELSQMYRRLWIWADGTTALYLPDEFRFETWDSCSLFSHWYFFSSRCTDLKENITFICEADTSTTKNITFPAIRSLRVYNWSEKIDVFNCESGEIISIDRKCDGLEDCFDKSDEQGCGSLAPIENRMFKCDNYGSYRYLAYSFVCNGVKECSQGDDEDFCSSMDDLSPGDSSVTCKLGLNSGRCNGIRDCPDGSDESNCEQCIGNTVSCQNFYCMPRSWMNDAEFDCPTRYLMREEDRDAGFVDHIYFNIPPPGVVYPDGYGKVTIKPLESGKPCPETHFQCSEGFCIPDYMLCNQHQDCPFGEDEISGLCRQECKGRYKCRLSPMCIHFDFVCDGYSHCPFKDDEIQCASKNVTCPDQCTCVQNEMTCTQLPNSFGRRLKTHSFDIHSAEIYSLGYLLLDNYSLIKLNASDNKITLVQNTSLVYPNLIVLDLSFNNIEHIPLSGFSRARAVETLILASNRLINKELTFLENTPNLKVLDLSKNEWSELRKTTFLRAQKLEKLILKDMLITKIGKDVFDGLESLSYLDLTGNPVTIFHHEIFDHSHLLSTLLTDNFRLCCDSIAPERVEENGKCIAPLDEISSCDDMLGSTFLRISLWTMAALTILGNVGVIYHRIFLEKGRRPGFRILITSLAFSDLIMGIYLVIIGTADAFYRHRFLTMEEKWKESVACQVAGYLCMLSSETSALFILAVTWDRAVAIALPFRPYLQLSKRTSTVVSAFVWAVALTIATIPLIPPYDSWKLYSQLAVGVPLPITRKDFPGIKLAYGVFIQMNMSIFTLVVIGQIVIWISIKKRSNFLKTEERTRQDLAIAQRLFLVVMTDCLCWIPIGVMGLLAKSGVAIPGNMYIVATVFLLPANSALNPFLYTLNAVLQKRREHSKLSKSS